MVAILMRCIKMSRQLLNKPDECRDEASLPTTPTQDDDEVDDVDLDEDIQGILSSSWSPIPSQPEDDATVTKATETMADKTQSNEKQLLQADDAPTEDRQDQQQEQASSSSRLNTTTTMPPTTPRTTLRDDQLSYSNVHRPSSSSSSHHHEHEYLIESESKVGREGSPSYYQYHPMNHRYYQRQNQYGYSGARYYHTQPEQDMHTSVHASSTMNSGQQYHHHSPYPGPGYYPAHEYGSYPPHQYNNYYSYHDSRVSGQDSDSAAAASASSYPGPPQRYAHPYAHHPYGASPSPSSYHHPFPHHVSFKESAASKVEPAGTAKGDKRSLDLTPPPDDDRKPSARSEKQANGKAKRIRDDELLTSYPPGPQRQQSGDFEPIPLNKISAIPILSSSSSSSVGKSGGTTPYSHTASYTSPYASAVAVGSSSRSGSAHVSPPMPHSTVTPASRKQPRILEPTSSGSGDTTSSTPSWERRFTELIEFKRSHGHCEVPQNYSSNPSLGTWVNKVREKRDNACSSGACDINRLTHIFFVFEHIISNGWSRRIA